MVAVRLLYSNQYRLFVQTAVNRRLPGTRGNKMSSLP